MRPFPNYHTILKGESGMVDLRDMKKVYCPMDPAKKIASSYNVGKIGEDATCKIDPKNHKS